MTISYNNYYAFGSLMPGRNASSGDYRYGYNKGSEMDNEITGVVGSHYTTYFREIDTRLGRMWSNDPVFQPWQSPYTSMDNNPIWFNDPLGDKIKSDRLDKKESKKQKKKVELAKVGDNEKTLSTSLGEKTGLNLSFDKDGYLTYEKDEDGNAIFSGGSEDARNDLIKGIDDEKFEYSIDWLNGASSVDGGNSTARQKGDFSGYVNLDIADFSSEDPKTLDIGMVFLHEYNHGYFGLKDNYTKATLSSGSDKPDFYGGTGYHKLGNPGETVLRVNTYRRQLGLAQRLTYEAMGGKVLFSKSYKYTNKRGKEKTKTNYFTLPAFEK